MNDGNWVVLWTWGERGEIGGEREAMGGGSFVQVDRGRELHAVFGEIQLRGILGETRVAGPYRNRARSQWARRITFGHHVQRCRATSDRQGVACRKASSMLALPGGAGSPELGSADKNVQSYCRDSGVVSGLRSIARSVGGEVFPRR